MCDLKASVFQKTLKFIICSKIYGIHVPTRRISMDCHFAELRTVDKISEYTVRQDFRINLE